MRKAIILLFALALSVSACGKAGPTGTAVASPTSVPTALATPQGEPKPLPADLIYKNPALVDNSNFEITPIEELHATGRAVDIDVDEYRLVVRLVVDGLVENPLRLGYEDILARPSVSEVVLLICPGFFADNAQWTGTPLAGILEDARVKPEAKQVSFHGADGYRSYLSLEEAMDEGVFPAYKVNGQALPGEHGYPLRLVARGKYGSRWVKWLVRIEVK